VASRAPSPAKTLSFMERKMRGSSTVMRNLVGVFAVFLSFAPIGRSQEAAPYRSPYRVELPFPTEELIPDLLKGERGAASHESEIPVGEWYRAKQRKFGSWGPSPRPYPFPAIANEKSAEWKRARVIATALRYVGYHYRHHHIPDWDPPQGLHTPAEGEPKHAGKGLDCSNFTSFIYNQGLGIHLNSDIHKQSEIVQAPINGSGRILPIKTIPEQSSFEEWKKALKPGDLIYVRSRQQKISHVIVWLGEWGISPDGIPLIMDSHGSDVKDSNGVAIPDGIHLRPFRPSSWYAKSSDHAHRIIE